MSHLNSVQDIVANKRQKIPKGQSKMNNTEKLERRQQKTKQKHNTMCINNVW